MREGTLTLSVFLLGNHQLVALGERAAIWQTRVLWPLGNTPTHDDPKARACAAFNDHLGSIMFTEKSLGSRHHNHLGDIRFLCLLFHHGPEGSNTIKYTMVAHIDDTFAAISRVWFRMLWDSNISPINLPPTLKHNNTFLEWTRTVRWLGLEGEEELHHTVMG